MLVMMIMKAAYDSVPLALKDCVHCFSWSSVKEKIFAIWSLLLSPSQNPGLVTGTEKLRALQEKFRHELVERAARAKSAQEPYNPPPRKSRLCNPKKHSGWFHLQGEKALHLACHTRKIMLKNLCTCIASHCIVNIFF